MDRLLELYELIKDRLRYRKEECGIFMGPDCPFRDRDTCILFNVDVDCPNQSYIRCGQCQKIFQ